MKRYITLLLIILNVFLFAQKQEKKLVEIGNTSISESEFIERFELSPQIGLKEKGSNEAIIHNFLYTLIAEKLWALKAQQMQLDTSEMIAATFKSIEKMYVRDALYKLEITDKVHIPETEYVKAYFKSGVKIKLNYLMASSEKEINGLHHMLSIGVPFDTLLALRKHLQPDSTFEVTYGTFMESIEDSVYKLFPDEYTRPVQGPEAWFIFRIKERLNAINDAKQQETAYSNARKILESRYTDKIYDEFYRKFFSGLKVRANAEMFWELSEKLTRLIIEKKERNKILDGERIILDVYDRFNLEDSFNKDSLTSTFIQFEENPVTLQQFIQEFLFEGFSSTTTNADTISRKLNSRIKDYISKELLAREGYKRGLQNLPDVQYSFKMWKDNYLSIILRNRFLDSSRVSDSEVLAQYQDYEKRNQNITLPVQVNIIEILIDSLEVVEKILNELNNNVDMHELAGKYSKRPWTKGSNGEFGFFPVTLHDEIGKVASQMEVGDVYGPLKVPEGYSVFKLIGKKEPDQASLKGFEEVKEELKNTLFHKKYNDAVTNYTVKLANEYGVTLNEEVLNNIKVSHIPMFTYRYFGFGGRLPAVPLSSPFHEWIKHWEGIKELP